MYTAAKNIIKAILPERVISKRGRQLRTIYSLAYRGNKYQCNICSTRLRKFIPLETGDLLCPRCGSLPRTRGLWKMIDQNLEGKKVLHFSPPECLRAAIVKQGNTEQYITSDYEGEFESDLSLDIEHIALETESIDVVICYHVLEHVRHDLKALKELYRILHRNGTCYIQTPFKSGEIDEDLTVTDPEQRLKLYGQKDHLRIYSAEGLTSRMAIAGFTVEHVIHQNEKKNYHGFKQKDITLIGRKV